MIPTLALTVIHDSVLVSSQLCLLAWMSSFRTTESVTFRRTPDFFRVPTMNLPTVPRLSSRTAESQQQLTHRSEIYGGCVIAAPQYWPPKEQTCETPVHWSSYFQWIDAPTVQSAITDFLGSFVSSSSVFACCPNFQPLCEHQ